MNTYATTSLSPAARTASEQFPWLRPDDLSLPMLPDQALRGMQMASDPDLTVTKLAGLVSKDPVLATRVLGLANSAMYGAMTPLRSVQDAVVRLGVACVRNVVVTVSLHAQMTAPDLYGAEGPRFMDHALGTAYLARLVAEVADEDVEEAFLTGLLHDIGKLVVHKTAHQRRKQGLTITDEELGAAVASTHAACGALALHFWKLPDETLDAVRHHHDYGLAVNPRAAAVCYAANRLSHRYGFGCMPEGDDVLEDAVWATLDLGEAWMAETDTRAPGLFNAARQALR
jgi:putative nucleotidyltransferase with HDIG domain